MGWIAAGGSAVLGYLLYRYYILPTPSQNFAAAEKDVTVKETDQQDLRPNFTTSSDVAQIPEQPNFLSPQIFVDAALEEKVDPRKTPTQDVLAVPSTAPPRVPTMALPSIRASSPPRLKPLPTLTLGNMSAPPRPNNAAPLRTPPSAAASLRVPATKVLPNSSMAPTSSIMPPQSKKPSRQVILKPGHSPLDWAMLTNSPTHNLRGKDAPANLIRVPPSQLKYQDGRKGRDAWASYQGKVYNITPYLPFHPGGEGELMRGAGRDAAKLFMEVHPWVNWENMLGECLVGILVGEGEERDRSGTSGGLDEMD